MSLATYLAKSMTDTLTEDEALGRRALGLTVHALHAALAVGSFALLGFWLGVLATLACLLMTAAVNLAVQHKVSDESFEALGAKLGAAWNFVRNPLRKAAV